MSLILGKNSEGMCPVFFLSVSYLFYPLNQILLPPCEINLNNQNKPYYNQIPQVCDKIEHTSIISIIGNIMSTFYFIFLGPLPFIPINPSLALIQAMISIYGAGYGMVKVSSFVRSQKAAIGNGFPDDIQTYNFVNGIIILHSTM